MPTTAARRVLIFACLALAAFLSIVTFAGCAGVERLVQGLDRPTARVSSLSLNGLDLDGATLGFEVEVDNPYNAPLPLASLRYALASGGADFLDGSADLSGTVPARGSRTVSLPARVVFADLLTALRGVRPGDAVPYDANLTLSVNAPGVGPIELPLRKSGELPVPAVPEVRVDDLKWDSLGLTGASGTLSLGVVNTNRFALDLREMGTALTLGGRRVADLSARDGLSLAPGGSGVVEIPLRLSATELGLGLLSMLRGGAVDYRVTGVIAGDTPFGPISLPYDSSGEAGSSRR